MRIVKKHQDEKNNQSICCVFLQLSLPLHKDLDDMVQGYQFEVTYMDEAMEFIDSLPLAAQKKIYYNADKVAGGVKDNELFTKLDGTDGFWEFRTKYNGMEYRLLAFWDEQENRLVVAAHGFVKKTWKIPSKEIQRAEQLRKKYYESK